MKILLYAEKKDPSVERLERMIKTYFDQLDFLTCRTIHSLTDELLRPCGYLRIVVFFVSRKEEFSTLGNIKKMLWNVRLILILPDNEIQTLLKAHQFFPRYLSYVDSDFKAVVTVLKRMLQ